MLVFEHCEACPAPCGGGTVTRSMRRVANATLLRFDRYDVDEPPEPDLRPPFRLVGIFIDIMHNPLCIHIYKNV